MTPPLLPAWFWYPWVVLFGTIIGSFLNVVIHRLPREVSVVFPASRCPACGHAIRPWDNVPVVSWLVLRGHCRDCGAPISPRYPAVEALTGMLFAAVLWKTGPSWALAPQFAFVAGLVAIIFVDLDHQVIPDVITLPGLAVGLAVTPLLPHTFFQGVMGVMVGCTFFYLTAVYAFAITGRESMGDGDIKMAAMMGAFLGWRSLLVAILSALLLGSATGLALLASRRRGRKDAIPFGPFLAAGALVALFFGEPLFEWYVAWSF